jgi:hypothetical protein
MPRPPPRRPVARRVRGRLHADRAHGGRADHGDPHTQSYATAEGAGLTAVEPSLTYKAKGTASTGPNDISADGTSNTSQWAGAALSASGTCFWIKDSVNTGTTYGSGTPCTGTAATAAAQPKW